MCDDAEAELRDYVVIQMMPGLGPAGRLSFVFLALGLQISLTIVDTGGRLLSLRGIFSSASDPWHI